MWSSGFERGPCCRASRRKPQTRGALHIRNKYIIITSKLLRLLGCSHSGLGCYLVGCHLYMLEIRELMCNLYGEAVATVRTPYDLKKSSLGCLPLALQWCHNERVSIVCSDVYSGADTKSKLHVTGLCEGNSPMTVEFPAQRTCNAENVSIWWRHHGSWSSTRIPITKMT